MKSPSRCAFASEDTSPARGFEGPGRVGRQGRGAIGMKTVWPGSGK
jgi:hypothetical protein